ncbi:hypothetical protein E2C01_098898 [Portunus trituberculatus]|uniref:Uncharacterized protein n=1 Tax=Portunus trituberculatus TaxID=210409 RepID=A0A5B7K856_PORTR|nr:hypothetical protein [Portunus trituberculatus]
MSGPSLAPSSSFNFSSITRLPSEQPRREATVLEQLVHRGHHCATSVCSKMSDCS